MFQIFHIRRIRVAVKAAVLVLALACWIALPNLHFPLSSALFWGGWILVAGSWILAKPIRTIAARWRLQNRLRSAIPEAGPLTNSLTAAAVAIKQAQEERALYLLQSITIKSAAPAAIHAHRWLSALAGVSWMARQKPGRPLSSLRHPFPQLNAIVFSFGPENVQLSAKSLARELREVTSEDLDAMAQQYIALIDVLIPSIGDRSKPFSEEADEMLLFSTGRSHMISSRERFETWWKEMRPVLIRGGGALIVGLRLLERELYNEAAELLNNLSQGGMLSTHTETLRRAAAFLSIFAQPQWRMTSGDIPRYFSEGCYYMAIEMGVLRYPTAEIPEVVSACQRGKMVRSAKRALIEESLGLWDFFGDELNVPFSLLMRRLLEHKGRWSNRGQFWKQQWNTRRGSFENSLQLVMDGVTQTAAGKLNAAIATFEKVAEMEPQSALPLVNLMYVHLLRGNADEARTLAAKIQLRFPHDGSALIAIGRMMAVHLEDTAEAKNLFAKALELSEAPTEALICLGEVSFMEGLYMEAQAYFDHARQVDPLLPDPKLGLARVYLETRRFQNAIEHLNAVVVEGPDEARDLANYLLYRTYREMGQDRRAFECLDKVPRKFFKEPDMLDDIAGHLESGHQYAKAREFAERAMILRASGDQHRDEGDALGV